MEENEVIKEIEHDDNCFWGYVGAFLGGLVGALPWLLLYYFYSRNIYICTFLIPVLAVSGYKFFKATVNKNTFKTILVIAILTYILTLFGLFPYFLAKKGKVSFIDFLNNSKYSEKYNNDLLEENNFDGEVFCFIIGSVIAYIEIAVLLERYKSTNGMIKDSNLFIRRDNDPIDSDDYNGILFTNKEENPVKSKVDVDKNISREEPRKNVDYAEYLRRKNNQLNNNDAWKDKQAKIEMFKKMEIEQEYRRNKKNNNVLTPFFIIIFLVIIFPQIMSFTASFQKLSEIGQKYNNIDNSDREYIFENYNLKVTMPYGWKAKSYSNQQDTVWIADNNGVESKKLIVMEKDNLENYDLEKIHLALIKTTKYYKNGIDIVNTRINGNNVCISEVKEDNYNRVYFTMEYNDYYIVLVDLSTDSDDYSNQKELLESVEVVR